MSRSGRSARLHRAAHQRRSGSPTRTSRLRWFGDDIAVKAVKYRHELRSVRTAAASMRMLGAGNAPLHRMRVGLEFALYGHRELDDTIAQHAAMARALGEQLGLPDEVLAALSGSYERWDGRGWPGELEGADVPIASRKSEPVAITLRYLQTLIEIGTEKNTTVVFPLPIDLLSGMGVKFAAGGVPAAAVPAPPTSATAPVNESATDLNQLKS